MKLPVLSFCLALVACGGGSAGPVASTPVVPSVAVPEETVLIGAGDIGWKGTDAQLYTGRVVQAAIDREHAFPFTTGDNAYPDGTYADYMANYHPFWGGFANATLAVSGNHEHHTKNAEGFFTYFGTAADPDRTRTGWYVKRLPTVLVVVLNSNADMGTNSPQLKWLRSILGAMPSHCTVALWHHPRFSSGKNGNNPQVNQFWRELYHFGADVVVNGHDHWIERFAPQNPDGKADPVRGIRQFTSGGGGAPLYDLKQVQPNSEFRKKAHGVLELRFRQGSYRWSFLGLDGTVLDTRPGDPNEYEACH